MFVKYIDEYEVEQAPRVLEGNGVYIANPLPATLAGHGYKPLEENVPNGESAEGRHWERRYEELEDKVVETWVEVEEPIGIVTVQEEEGGE